MFTLTVAFRLQDLCREVQLFLCGRPWEHEIVSIAARARCFGNCLNLNLPAIRIIGLIVLKGEVFFRRKAKLIFKSYLQTLFLGLFWQQSKKEKVWKKFWLWKKSGANPFKKKMPKIAIFNTRFFYCLESFSIDLEHWQTLFLGLIWQKKKEKNSNFWQN